ncbi:MAG: hypothetical protein HKN57_02940 [Xanthomonadales bacterium]|nr:LssY C-terminal domain-containing protein [Gammaproteobacteria bacterium]NND56182.1 hypothetical protein [Xanthomonadales bacterium]NNK50587.1 hypothetical protein [Xanthomonadales bacterium]
MYIMLNERNGYARLAPLFLLFTLAACSLTPYSPDDIAAAAVQQRAQVQEEGVFRVRASVPGVEEAKQIFGIPLYRRGIQPVWLEISNLSSTRSRVLLSSIDPDYFAPFEVAYMHKKYFSKQGWQEMEKHLYRNALPRQIAPGETVSGYVFTHNDIGTKSFNVDIFDTGSNSRYEEFTFFIEVPGFKPDYAEVDFETLYSADERVELDNEGLRDMLKRFPCCTSDRSGDSLGMPVNVLLVASGRDVLKALLRAEWSETTYEKDDNYLNNSSYLFNRPPDAVFRKSRGVKTERNELSLWLSPYRVDGRQVWMGQVKHAIGRRFQVGEWFFGTALDPDVDDGRNYLMQNLWYSQSLETVAFSASGIAVAQNEPALDFDQNPYFSDGFRIVMWISGSPVALVETRSLKWDLKPNRDVSE